MTPEDKKTLEEQTLRFINNFLDESNPHALKILKKAKEQDLFFPQYYEMMFNVGISKAKESELSDWVSSYQSLGITSANATKDLNEILEKKSFSYINELFSIKSGSVLKDFHNVGVFVEEKVLKRLDCFTEGSEYSEETSLSKSELALLIKENNAIKSYITLYKQLPENNKKKSTPKI